MAFFNLKRGSTKRARAVLALLDAAERSERSSLRRCVENDVGPRIVAALGPRASLALRLSSRWWRDYVARASSFASNSALRSAIRVAECDLYDRTLSDAHARGNLFSAADWEPQDDALVFSHAAEYATYCRSYYNPVIVALPRAANRSAQRSFAVTMQCRQINRTCVATSSALDRVWCRIRPCRDSSAGGFVALSCCTRAELLAPSARPALQPGVVCARDLDIQVYQATDGQFTVSCATPGTVEGRAAVRNEADEERCGVFVSNGRTVYTLRHAWARRRADGAVTHGDAFRVEVVTHPLRGVSVVIDGAAYALPGYVLPIRPLASMLCYTYEVMGTTVAWSELCVRSAEG